MNILHGLAAKDTDIFSGVTEVTEGVTEVTEGVRAESMWMLALNSAGEQKHQLNDRAACWMEWWTC